MARAKSGKNSTGSVPRPQVISRAEPKEIRDLPHDLEERIRARAYELWEQRGRHHGNPVEDWLRAEREIRGQRSQLRTA